MCKILNYRYNLSYENRKNEILSVRANSESIMFHL